MAINKVQFGGSTLIDLSTDTVATANDIAQGKVGHLNDGTVVTGTHSGSSFAFILATYPSGSTCTCTNGSTTLTAEDTSGYYVFSIPSASTWTVSCTDGSESASSLITITYAGQSETVTLSYKHIYGISRDITNSSPAWTRTDDAVGFTFSASVGDTAGSSSFDTCYPWNGITRETINGDVMVKIPKFWFKRYLDGNVEHIEICDKQYGDYALHPAFQHNGTTQDYIYVGAYKMTSGYHSVSGSAPLVNQTRASFRSGCRNRGTGYSQLDITTFSAIQMLVLVETATNDSQSAIGRGYCDGNSSAINTGSCDSVANLTGRPTGTDGKVDVVYRGIEGFWGNIWEWFDGLNWNGGAYWICNNQSNFADDTSTNYTQLGYNGGSTGWSSSYITAMGCDLNNQAIILPTTAGSGSATTYYADAVWSSTGWRVARRGGGWNDGSMAGLFVLGVAFASSSAGSSRSSRLLYIPS